VLELVSRIVVVDSGRLVMDGPRDQVLAALSGARPPGQQPAQPQPQPGQAPQGAPVHVHPAAQAMNRAASV
jgi:ATP-binding cassette subfamily C protein LapB